MDNYLGFSERHKIIDADYDAFSKNQISTLHINRTPFVYCFFDPITMIPKYIGQTVNLKSRLRAYYNDVKEVANRQRNYFIALWLKWLKNRGLRPIFRILKVTTLENIKKIEKKYIEEYSKKYRLLNVAYNVKKYRARSLNCFDICAFNFINSPNRRFQITLRALSYIHAIQKIIPLVKIKYTNLDGLKFSIKQTSFSVYDRIIHPSYYQLNNTSIIEI